MGLLMLIMGAIVVVCIYVVAKEYREASERERSSKVFREELESVKTELNNIGIQEDVVDTKLELKERKEELKEKEKDL